MSIENPTLAHFRHFSSLFTNFPSTSVEKPLLMSRILYKSALFIQNKPNFLDTQMNVTSLITADYENIANWKVRKNKANTKPNKANLLNAQMNVNKVLTKDYENKHPGGLRKNKPNTKPIQTQSNPICSELACPEPACPEHRRRVEGVEPISKAKNAVAVRECKPPTVPGAKQNPT